MSHSIHSERLKQLPLGAGQVWQGGWVGLPGMLSPRPAGQAIAAPVWVCAEPPGVRPGEPDLSGDQPVEGLLALLADFATDEMGCRPERVEVRDAALADALIQVLAGTGIRVTHAAALPVLDQLTDMMGQFAEEAIQSLASPVPPAIKAQGVTLERLRGFAEAAKAFYDAEVWDQLTDEDLIKVESPKAPTGMGYVTVLGAGGHVFGLSFYGSKMAYESLREDGPMALLGSFDRPDMWSVTYDDIEDVLSADRALWSEHELPLPRPDRFPVAACSKSDNTITRPTGKRLAYIEGLLRALAATTDQQIDSGRWTVEVQTSDGPQSYRLAIPSLLREDTMGLLKKIAGMFSGEYVPDRRVMERSQALMHRYLAEHPVDSPEQLQQVMQEKLVGKGPDEIEAMIERPKTPSEEAQDLCYDAVEMTGRKQLQAVRRAIELDPNCADAYVLLAERTGDLDKRLQRYEAGARAGRQALGPAYFEQDVGHFWGILETRPYMRALMGLADTLAEMDRLDEAVEHYQELLRLNPNDNQGVRYVLLPVLIEARRFRQAKDLLGQYDEDSAMWSYSRTLISFATSGDSQHARGCLADAMRANPHVPEILIDEGMMPEFDVPATYQPGEPDEAIIYAKEAYNAWASVEGALEWLAHRARSLAAESSRRDRHAYKKRKRKSR